MPINLEQHRSGTDVWERVSNVRNPWDAERWAAGVAAGGCLVGAAFSKRPQSVLLVIAGGLLGWWAATTCDDRTVRKARLRAVLPHRSWNGDFITEASEDSFPASDAPSFTASTGNTLGTSRTAH